jgi:putative ABC transport system substrate-binding protein
MNRRTFLFGFTLGTLAAPLAPEAQQAAKLARIGFLGLNAPSVATRHTNPFRHALRDLGWIDGNNVSIEYRWAEGKPERLPVLARELVQLSVDVLVTSGAPAALAAQQATATIPIVMAQINDPVALGLVASLSKPGSNITGLATLHSELGSKQIELIKEAVPKASRLAVLWHPGNPGARDIVTHTRHAARTLGLALLPVEVRGAGDLAAALTAMKRQRADALLVAPDPLLLPYSVELVQLTIKHGLPTMFGWSELVEAGGLMAYGPSIPEIFRRAAVYVDKILKGAKPADLPVEQPTKFELVINMKTAKALGLTIPPSVLARADQVIE